MKQPIPEISYFQSPDYDPKRSEAFFDWLFRLVEEAPPDTHASTMDEARRQAHEKVVLSLWGAGAFCTCFAADELNLTCDAFLCLVATKGISDETGTSDAEAIEQLGRG